ncbi:uncharacterized protein LOC126894314 [Daktulosphaira vitifoliae]|uniref:uncharacterized protein LOC126894314 n=1 Tax=Daktulosphaira vitifoliae TaxID=58002 RepID=UPI0021AB0254|nr:uncharacterized protein LOC126894314 [Daktulosphaira vitifoliae]
MNIFMVLVFSVSIFTITVNANYSLAQDLVNFNTIDAIDSLRKCFGKENKEYINVVNKNNQDRFYNKMNNICKHFCLSHKQIVSEYKLVEDFLCDIIDESCKKTVRECIKRFHDHLFDVDIEKGSNEIWGHMSKSQRELIKDITLKIKCDFRNDEKSLKKNLISLQKYLRTLLSQEDSIHQ